MSERLYTAPDIKQVMAEHLAKQVIREVVVIPVKEEKV